jgi:hypothetical protein
MTDMGTALIPLKPPGGPEERKSRSPASPGAKRPILAKLRPFG